MNAIHCPADMEDFALLTGIPRQLQFSDIPRNYPPPAYAALWGNLTISPASLWYFFLKP